MTKEEWFQRQRKSAYSFDTLMDKFRRGKLPWLWPNLTDKQIAHIWTYHQSDAGQTL